ncbi:Transferrin binding protein-like solute binding protein [Parasphingorhabdus marina DSM 22363]|uniref:Transferrin binding protein-like solute binding protein n=1 Tax=Parasphingorhabdus marina DSM 22363 TaxID=1123272 RepID=A0A1N6HSQ4_9SPHN|nr:transferrin-binding protein-like solute binding protein [Parasphingorhabdus marina]SIO22685.1 Transferrin binding protein-like solute binding protein [Parasphingorhabdus marina DSM 22363]
MTIVYNPANRSYTLTSGNRNQTFGFNDKDNDDSNFTALIFRKRTGDIVDNLIITQATTTPVNGYEYVGGAVWERGDSGSLLTGDAFTFGVETPDNATPRTGSATFAARLIATGYWQDGFTDLSGTGLATVEFATGNIAASGLARELSTETKLPVASGDWSASAQLASTRNAFDGTLQLYQGSGYAVSGALSGRLYGPQSQELGGAFGLNGTSSLGSGSVVGVLLGSRVDPATTNMSVAPLTADQEFRILSNSLVIDILNATGVTDENPWNPDVRYAPDLLTYNASENSYKLSINDNAGGTEPLFTGAIADDTTSDGRFVSYVSTNGEVHDQLRLYRPAGSNSEISLTYSSFGNFRRTEPATDIEKTAIANSWFYFGIPTNPAAIPAFGTATYRGTLHGTANYGLEGSRVLEVEGTSLFVFDFGTSSLTGNLHPFVIEHSGARTDLGEWSFANAQVSTTVVSDPRFTVALETNVGVNGQVFGRFFGPAADEVAGIFSAQFRPPNGFGNTGNVVGAFGAGK